MTCSKDSVRPLNEAITRSVRELGYSTEAPAADSWDCESFRIYALWMLEVAGIMPNPDTVVRSEHIIEFIQDEVRATIVRQVGVFKEHRAWGYDIFCRGEDPQVVLENDLCSPILLKSTLAHELGHLLLHKVELESDCLYRIAAYRGYDGSLRYMTTASESTAERKGAENIIEWVARIMQDEKDIHNDVFGLAEKLPPRPFHQWTREEQREFQANQFMVGFLMPCLNLRRYIANFFLMELDKNRRLNGWTYKESWGYRGRKMFRDCVYAIAKAFDVSVSMAAIELGRLMRDQHNERLFKGEMVYPRQAR